jgi:hypothetical protein
VQSSNSWLLMRADTVLGTLGASTLDQPWQFCRFEPTLAFADVAGLFQRELELLNGGDIAEWEEAYDAIDALELRLVRPDSGDVIREFILHVEDGEAWFRCQEPAWRRPAGLTARSPGESHLPYRLGAGRAGKRPVQCARPVV